MTKNRRAKDDARARMAATGESYSTARRHASGESGPRFDPDHCANCLNSLPPQIEGLFCSELCSQTAETVRYWRRVTRDGRIEEPDVRLVLNTKIAHLLSGGYAKRARQLSDGLRAEVWRRDQRRCRICGEPGAEIDHIAGDSSALDNLQLLCVACHHRKTGARMVPAPPERVAYARRLERERVTPDEPRLLCDDENGWADAWRNLRKERRARLLEELAEHGYTLADFPGQSWADMWDAVLDDYEYDDDEGGGPEDYDGGYGPNSYFAHAMAKDD
ncbi:HNH endonuclease [Actinoplanes sp. HUAS TT8]|uniref:HNH endonuclease n=1 Tax=Actinoplanes sp. HUAS TT8 TaxID=3447453 RepID=UPI003F51E829